ncbi:hypothetical protein ALQ72_05128 [Pseudomonas syringae pv. maculicola]|nr:hypothetical protein ALQ72_05128 [Pseudomonas syringae pv. maculicola]
MARCECDGCGRAIEQPKRIYQEKRYCGNCYPRLFKRRLCPACGNFARLPTFDKTARCSACLRRGSCARCNKVDFKIGRITPYGPVCKPCAVHFREPAICDACGTLSQRTARNSLTGRLLCPKCSGPAAETCPDCRRHRVLISELDGRKRCKVCIEQGVLACATCGVSTPAGRGKECERCYWERTFQKRLAINTSGLSVLSMAQRFERFGNWVLLELGPKAAALKINTYYKFFKELENVWQGVPQYSQLLRHFSAEGLRRSRVPMSWLSEFDGLVVCEQAREEDSEHRRVQGIMEQPRESWPQQLITGYHRMLQSRLAAGDISLRSIRLALRSASDLLDHSRLKAAAMIDQKVLDGYWRKSPGHVASVTGFVGYLNQVYNAGLNSRPDPRWARQQKQAKRERELVELLPQRDETSDFESRWIVKALAYFHGIGRVSRKGLVYTPATYQGTAGFNIECSQRVLWVPSASTYERTIEE